MPVRQPTYAHDPDMPVWVGCRSWWDFLDSIVLGILLAPVGLGLILLSSAVYNRARFQYLVTAHRVAVRYGIFIKSSREIRIKDIRSMVVARGGIGGFFGIGSIEFCSAANERAEIIFFGLADAERVKSLVSQLQTAGDDGSVDLKNLNIPPSSTPLSGFATIIAMTTILLMGLAVVLASYGVYRTYQMDYGAAPAPVATVSPSPVPSLPQPAVQPTTTFPVRSPVAAPAGTSIATPAPAPTPSLPPRSAAFLADVRYSQQAAVERYPQLGVRNSALNKKFLARLAEWKLANDPRLNHSDWPLQLADECAQKP